MPNIVSASVAESDDNYKEMKLHFDSFTTETKRRRIKCTESVRTLYTYEKVLSSDAALAEEGIGTVVEKPMTMYNFDVFTVDQKTVSYPERMITGAPVTLDIFDVRDDSYHSVIDIADRGEKSSTVVKFKFTSFDFFAKNPSGYVSLLLKANSSNQDITNGVGLAFGAVGEPGPSVKYTGLASGVVLGFDSGANADAPPILADNIEYSVELKVYSQDSTRKFIYSISGGGISYISNGVEELPATGVAYSDDTFTGVDHTYNDIIIITTGANANSTQWSSSIYDVKFSRS